MLSRRLGWMVVPIGVGSSVLSCGTNTSPSGTNGTATTTANGTATGTGTVMGTGVATGATTGIGTATTIGTVTETTIATGTMTALTTTTGGATATAIVTDTMTAIGTTTAIGTATATATSGTSTSTATATMTSGGMDGGSMDGAATSDASKGPDSAGAPDAMTTDASTTVGASVLEHHLHATRDGAYTDANVTTAAAGALKMDANFKPPAITGTIYGQPLYVDGWKTGQDAIFVATDQNHVTALDGMTGAMLWDVTLGPAVPLTKLPCGQPYPFYGVNSTPIINLATRTLYTESFQTPDGGTTFKHYVYALSIDTGMTQTGWPVDVGATVKNFTPGVQQNRGALELLGGTVYVPYAGLNGDCGTYHGWVVGISTTTPTTVASYSTSATRGGIWGALASDGTSLFATTGNTAKGTTTWSGGEALIRFTAGPKFSGATTDYFTPSNWEALDTGDADLGSSAPILFDMPGATLPHLAAAMGKFGVVHLLNRDSLGGKGTGNGTTGEGLFSLSVNGENGQIKGTPATYTTAKGRYIVLRTELGNPNAITVCPTGTSGDMLALSVTTANPPTLVPAWCAVSGGQGSPIATTTDGTSNALLWVVSTGGTNKLLAFNGDTGVPVTNTAAAMGTVQHWTSPIVAKGRFIVGGGSSSATAANDKGAVYAFTTQ